MIIKNNKLISNGLILSLPGILSIFISLISIPIHLNIAGAENYGNYLVFHFLLTISLILNLGIGKSIVISMNNFPQKSKAIAYQGLKYTFMISLFVLIIFIVLFFIKIYDQVNHEKFIDNSDDKKSNQPGKFDFLL